MKWIKKGLVDNPEMSWSKKGVLTPTPFILNDNVIRIYCSFRDEKGHGRIGYIDVNSSNPSEVLRVSEKPVLDVGNPGMFDDNGVILGDVVRNKDKIYMYYVGFQIVKRVKFVAFSGLAISKDNGETFRRYSQTPIMDRVDNALYIRAIHSVIKEENKWKVWYSVGNGWEEINGIKYPQYNIRYTESIDGINFLDKEGKLCIDVDNNEYRIGRPRVRKVNNRYEMRFTFDTLDKEYKTGVAFSEDGINWVRDDSKVGIYPSKTGWDSQMLCYPVIIEVKGNTYMFYSGNNMGETGVGFAVFER